jgi:arylsulfatase A-like enzyme
MPLLNARKSFRISWCALLLLTAIGCGKRPPAMERIWLDFADHVWFQSGNVTTDLISAPRRVGLQNLGYGWRQIHSEDPARAAFEMDVAAARLFFFSADGDTTAIEIEISAVGRRRLKVTPLNLLLNGRPLTKLPLSRKWEQHRVEIPAPVIRRGNNRLDFQIAIPKKSQKSRHRLRPKIRNLRFFATNGRREWPERPTTLQVAGDPELSLDRDTIQMPSPARLEAVIEVPERARLTARFQVRRPPGADLEPVLVYAKLLDPELEEHPLAQERVTESRSAFDFDVDLSAWQGQRVRLQLGAGGPGNAVVSWHWAIVEAQPGQTPPGSIAPIRRQPAPSSGRLGRPDVLVVLLDAARADSFSPFGGTRPTPHTARLASQGTVFQQAMAASSWTGQSIPSIFTGLYPDSLRVGPWGSPLPSNIATLAELLSGVGYRTVLWTQHPFYGYQEDLKRGFQEFHRPEFRDYRTLPSQEILISEQQPTFAFVHLIPPHAPYTPPPPHRGLYSSWYSGSIEPEATFLSRFPDKRSTEELTEEDRRFIRDRYDENVAFADAQVGALLSILDSSKRYEDSLVILMSDHGEAFLEHGRYLHSRMLFREFLHVPLVIKWPRGVSGYEAEVAEPMSLVDLVPTLEDGLALPAQQEGYQGRSLIPLVFDGAHRQEPLWATTRRVDTYQKPPRPLEMLQAGPWKILYDPLSDSSRIYQIENDPGESQDLSGELPMRTLYLRQALLRQRTYNRELLQQAPEPGPIEDSDAEIQKQLEALGYLN